MIVKHGIFYWLYTLMKLNNWNEVYFNVTNDIFNIKLSYKYENIIIYKNQELHFNQQLN